MFSPDGRWIAYRSDESGTNEIYVRPFPGGQGGKWQISTGGGLYANVVQQRAGAVLRDARTTASWWWITR